jgi:hypothetical protein
VVEAMPRLPGMSDFAAQWLFGDGEAGGTPFVGGAAVPAEKAGQPPPFLASRPSPQAAQAPREQSAEVVPRGRVIEGPPGEPVEARPQEPVERGASARVHGMPHEPLEGASSERVDGRPQASVGPRSSERVDGRPREAIVDGRSFRLSRVPSPRRQPLPPAPANQPSARTRASPTPSTAETKRAGTDPTAAFADGPPARRVPDHSPTPASADSQRSERSASGTEPPRPATLSPVPIRLRRAAVKGTATGHVMPTVRLVERLPEIVPVLEPEPASIASSPPAGPQARRSILRRLADRLRQSGVRPVEAAPLQRPAPDRESPAPRDRARGHLGRHGRAQPLPLDRLDDRGAVTAEDGTETPPEHVEQTAHLVTSAQTSRPVPAAEAGSGQNALPDAGTVPTTPPETDKGPIVARDIGRTTIATPDTDTAEVASTAPASAAGDQRSTVRMAARPLLRLRASRPDLVARRPSDNRVAPSPGLDLRGPSDNRVAPTAGERLAQATGATVSRSAGGELETIDFAALATQAGSSPPVTAATVSLAESSGAETVDRAPAEPMPRSSLSAGPELGAADQSKATHQPGTLAGSHAVASPEMDELYEHVVERLRRELLFERERMGDLLGDLP